jgi:hypothetical protein
LYDPEANVQEQHTALHGTDAPVVSSCEEMYVLQAKINSSRNRDIQQGKAGLPLTLADAITLVEESYLRYSVTGVTGVLRKGALLQLSVDAIDSTRSHCADNVQLMLTQLNYAKNCTPDAEFRKWAASAFKQ